jgi:hypothetical protein
MSFTRWRRRLLGERVETFLQPDQGDEGYYRKPVKKKLNNGQWQTLGWNAVGLWMGPNGQMTGLIHSWDNPIIVRDLTRDELTSEEFWSYIVANPISYETYEKVAGGEPWPDSKEVQLANTMPDIPAADREVAKDDNKPPEDLPLDVQHRNAIMSAVGVAKAFTVTSDDTAEQGLGIKNRLAELRLAAQRDGEAAYKPVYAEYKRLFGIWNPMVGLAEDEEKSLNGKLLTWRESERRRIAAEAEKVRVEAAKAAAAEAERKRLEEEAAQRAADRAIIRGEPEAAPEIHEEAPCPAPPAAASTPAPAPLRPTYGKRKLKEEEKTFLDETQPIDFDALYQHFKNTEVVQLTLKTLALAAVRSGSEVPGVKTRRGLI